MHDATSVTVLPTIPFALGLGSGTEARLPQHSGDLIRLSPLFLKICSCDWKGHIESVFDLGLCEIEDKLSHSRNFPLKMITTFAASHPLQSSQSLPFLLIEKRGRTFMWSQQYLVGILLILVQPTLILFFEFSSKNPVSHHIRERGISAGCCLFSAAKEEQHIRFISILQRSSAAVKPDFRKGKCFASMLLHQGVAVFVLITIFHFPM